MKSIFARNVLGCLIFTLAIFTMAEEPLGDGVYAVIETSKGKITGQLFYKKVPMTVANFVGLSEGTLVHNRGAGKPFYDGLTFHRVINGFMVQGGCPNGTGAGDPGYSFGDEFHPELKHDKAGIFSMANSGPATNGSQFFITHAPQKHLDNRHSVFGQVTQGMDVVNAIVKGDTITSVKIMRVGKEAQEFLVSQASFEELKKKAAEARAKAEAEKNKAVLEQIAQKHPGLKKTDSGLQFKITTEGEGAKPAKGDIVKVHVSGTLANGREVINTLSAKQPLEFPVGTGVMAVKGWDEGILDMKKGEKRTLVVPPSLAFGARGMPQAGIGPNEFLICEMNLVTFSSKEEHEAAQTLAAVSAKADAMKVIKAKFPKVETTKSGLMYVVTSKGEGDTPKNGQKVSVHYVGTLLDGKEFDSSRKRNTPFEFTLGGGVIKGWNEGVALMKKGEKRTLIVPPDLGYGARGIGPIPPNAFLIFEIELLDIK